MAKNLDQKLDDFYASATSVFINLSLHNQFSKLLSLFLNNEGAIQAYDFDSLFGFSKAFHTTPFARMIVDAEGQRALKHLLMHNHQLRREITYDLLCLKKENSKLNVDRTFAKTMKKFAILPKDYPAMRVTCHLSRIDSYCTPFVAINEYSQITYFYLMAMNETGGLLTFFLEEGMLDAKKMTIGDLFFQPGKDAIDDFFLKPNKDTLTPFEHLAKSQEGCVFLQKLLRLNKDLIPSLPQAFIQRALPLNQEESMNHPITTNRILSRLLCQNASIATLFDERGFTSPRNLPLQTGIMLFAPLTAQPLNQTIELLEELTHMNGWVSTEAGFSLTLLKSEALSLIKILNPYKNKSLRFTMTPEAGNTRYHINISIIDEDELRKNCQSAAALN